MSKKSISVVVPNFNGRQLLEENLPAAFAALAKAGVDYEFIVVDDASTDDSVSFLQGSYPQIIVLRNEENMGFSPTVNKGIRHCQKELVLILNSDVLLTENYLEPLFAYFDEADTFGVSGRIIGLHDDAIQEAAKYPRQLWYKKIQPFNFYVQDATGYRVPTLYLSGASALMDRQKLQQLGGYFEVYAPFYVEDADLGARAWLSGWRCYYEHHAICRHPASVTIKKYNHKRKIWITTNRNRLIFHSLYLRPYSLVLWYFRLVITLIGNSLIFKWKYHRAFADFRKRRKAAHALLGKNVTAASLEAIMKDLRREIDAHTVIRVK